MSTYKKLLLLLFAILALSLAIVWSVVENTDNEDARPAIKYTTKLTPVTVQLTDSRTIQCVVVESSPTGAGISCDW